jgi:hypothetical protein
VPGSGSYPSGSRAADLTGPLRPAGRTLTPSHESETEQAETEQGEGARLRHVDLRWTWLVTALLT